MRGPFLIRIFGFFIQIFGLKGEEERRRRKEGSLSFVFPEDKKRGFWLLGGTKFVCIIEMD